MGTPYFWAHQELMPMYVLARKLHEVRQSGSGVVETSPEKEGS